MMAGIRKKSLFVKITIFGVVATLLFTISVNLFFLFQMETLSLLRTGCFTKEDDVKTGRRRVTELKDEERIHTEPKHNAKSIHIGVYSSKDIVSVSVDGIKVMENNISRGIHVTVLSQATGALMSTRTFDTHFHRESSNLMITFLNMTSQGRILCFAVKDEASANLNKAARNFIRSLGSIHIDHLGWRENWAFITTNKKGNNYNETYEHAPAKYEWANTVTVQAVVPLVPEKRCRWDDSEQTKRRRAFCDRFEGYGKLCSCSNPTPIDITSSLLSENRVANIPVAIIASNRPYYLYRALRSMLSANGAKKELFTVFIDGFFEEPAAIARLFGINVVQHVPISTDAARISQHYKRTLSETFDAFPDAKYMIILEEDLDVSVDIFSYFSQLLPLMDEDESLYCVSAWNDQGYDHTCKDPAMLYRMEGMPGLGWLLKRDLFKELEPKWPKPDAIYDWDWWMRYSLNRKGRECIIPDVSRTYHFGSMGLNVDLHFQSTYLTTHALNTEPNVKFDTSLMKKDNYEKEIERLLSGATVLDHSKNPCKNKKDFIPDTTGKTYVFYIKMKDDEDWVTWTNVAKCLKIYDKDPRGYHKSMWRMWLKGNHVLIVGSPASPYAKHKPDDVKPISIQRRGPSRVEMKSEDT